MVASKKRKAEALEDGAKPIKNGRKSPSIDPTVKEDLFQDHTDNSSETQEMPFAVECPARPPKRRKSRGKDDVFGPEIENDGFKDLGISYSVRPGSEWGRLRTYRNFIVGETKFSVGSIVYVNRHSPAPTAPPPSATEAEILAYDRKNFWVAKVLEVRASDPQHVYLRVFWLYWPDELPQGRQKYHGQNELVMSNHMDIVDAMTVGTAAEVKFWDERDEDEDLGQRYWRQFYDVRGVNGKDGGLSELRRHCTCHEYYNPDKLLLKCPHKECGLWNHDECLLDAILTTTYRVLVEESGPAKTNGLPQQETSPTKKVRQTLAKTLSAAAEATGLKARPSDKRVPVKVETPRSKAKIKPKTVGGKPWEDMFRAEIVVMDAAATGHGVNVKITDERGQDPEMWSEDVECLRCGKVLD